MEIKQLNTEQVRKRRKRPEYLRSLQSVTLPQTEPFELHALFKILGTENPSHAQFNKLRHRLTDAGYKFAHHSKRLEFWTHESNSARSDEIDKRTYTIPIFIKTFYPGATPPYSNQTLFEFRKVMLSRGYRPRNSEEYWSMKATRRKPKRTNIRKVNIPQYIRIPNGSFALLDLLELNHMRRYPENFVWARSYLQSQGINRLHGTNHYCKSDARGKLPAYITGNWEAPGLAFTTYQFQHRNNARKVTADQWKSAVDWLTHNGYTYDPQWKRWRKK